MHEEELPGGWDDAAHRYPDGPIPPYEREWRHPSELHFAGVFDETHTDRLAPPTSRGLVLATSLCGAAVALLVAYVIVAGGEDPQRTAVPAASVPRTLLAFVAQPARTLPRPPTVTQVIASRTTVVIDKIPEPSSEVMQAPTLAPPAPTAAPRTLAPRTDHVASTTTVVVASTTLAIAASTVPNSTKPPSTAPPRANPPASRGRGSFVVDADYGVTTAPGLSLDEQVSVSVGNATLSASVVAIDNRRQLAVLRFDVHQVEVRNASISTIDPAMKDLDSVTASAGAGAVALTRGPENQVGLAVDPTHTPPPGTPVTLANGQIVGLCVCFGGDTTLVPVTEAASVVATAAGWIGVTLGELDGVVTIDEVATNSPAQRSGLQVGHVVMSVEGHAADHVDEIVTFIRRARPGSSVVVVVREARADALPLTVSVTLGAAANAPG